MIAKIVGSQQLLVERAVLTGVVSAAVFFHEYVNVIGLRLAEISQDLAAER